MSAVKREIGQLLAGRVADLPDEITRDWVCGCFAEDIRVQDGVPVAFTGLLGFHDPCEPHRDEREIAVAHLILGSGEGGAC